MRRKEREISSRDEMDSIIKLCDVCRIALADNGIPYLVAMNFGYIPDNGGTLWFHSATEGMKLDMIRKNNYVCFGMDTGHGIVPGPNACDFSMKYASITGWGRIVAVTTDEDKKRGLDAIMEHYTGKRGFTYDTASVGRIKVLRLEIEKMTCKRAG